VPGVEVLGEDERDPAVVRQLLQEALEGLEATRRSADAADEQALSLGRAPLGFLCVPLPR
jgi:hypothetical protein